MGGGVHTQCQPRHDGETRAAQRTRKKAGILCALRSGVAAAHDGEASSCGKRLVRKQMRRAHHIQQQRGVFGFQQRLWIANITQSHDVTGRPLWVSSGQPLAGDVKERLPGGWNLTQSPRLGNRHTLLQHRRALLKNRRWKPESRQQPARRAVANAGRQRQTQPCPQLFSVHHSTGHTGHCGRRRRAPVKKEAPAARSPELIWD